MSYIIQAYCSWLQCCIQPLLDDFSSGSGKVLWPSRPTQRASPVSPGMASGSQGPPHMSLGSQGPCTWPSDTFPRVFTFSHQLPIYLWKPGTISVHPWAFLSSKETDPWIMLAPRVVYISIVRQWCSLWFTTISIFSNVLSTISFWKQAFKSMLFA